MQRDVVENVVIYVKGCTLIVYLIWHLALMGLVFHSFCFTTQHIFEPMYVYLSVFNAVLAFTTCMCVTMFVISFCYLNNVCIMIYDV